MSIPRSGWYLSLLTLMAAIVLGTGCVTNGRRLLLKEYGPSVPLLADGSLKGVTVCLKGFDSATNLVSLETTNKPEEPKPFKYMDFTHEQDMLWDKEMKAMQQQPAKADWKEIGNMRDAFGIVMSHVYALNDAGVWLAEGLKYDLGEQGAKVVDASESASADVSISGTIQLCRLDMYMTINGDLVVDIDVQPQAGRVAAPANPHPRRDGGHAGFRR
jgi:hypothetical protein